MYKVSRGGWGRRKNKKREMKKDGNDGVPYLNLGSSLVELVVITWVFLLLSLLERD